jgi:hypothetical protein
MRTRNEEDAERGGVADGLEPPASEGDVDMKPMIRR